MDETSPARRLRRRCSRSLWMASSVVMGLFAVAGGVAFYEIFADDTPRPTRSASRLRPTPFASAGTDGFVVGLAGRF